MRAWMVCIVFHVCVVGAGPGTELIHGRLAGWIKWRACDVGQAKEGLGIELWRRWSNRRDWGMSGELGKATEALLILQPFRHFTYVTTHCSTLLSLYLSHSSFSNHSVASPTSQVISQPFFRLSYVTSSSLNSPGEPPMSWYLFRGGAPCPSVVKKYICDPELIPSPDRSWLCRARAASVA